MLRGYDLSPRISVEGVRNSENISSLLDRSDRFLSDKCRGSLKFKKTFKLDGNDCFSTEKC